MTEREAEIRIMSLERMAVEAEAGRQAEQLAAELREVRAGGEAILAVADAVRARRELLRLDVERACRRPYNRWRLT